MNEILFIIFHVQHMEVFKRRQSDRSTSLTILWGCIQAGQNDPVIGLQGEPSEGILSPLDVYVHSANATILNDSVAMQKLSIL